MRIPVLCFLTLLCVGSSWAFQTDVVMPWVTNNDTFGSLVVVNNLNDAPANVTLKATRINGSTDTFNQTIPALGQLVMTSAELFTAIGKGAGYAVRLTSDSDNIHAGWVVIGTESASGSSPAQADPVPVSEASNILLYNFFTLGGNGFSAPVAVNLDNSEAVTTFIAFQNGDQVAAVERNIPGNTPFTELTSSLFPGLTGDIYVVAVTDKPLVGASFIFNEFIEPSMASAIPLDAVPGPMDPPATVSFVNDVQPIFNANCANGVCHFNGNSSGGLQLDPDLAYDETVNVLSDVPFPPYNGLFRIEPFNVEDSYLFRKLLPNEGDNVYTGNRMPNNSPPLSDAEIETIRTWILEGAQDN